MIDILEYNKLGQVFTASTQANVTLSALSTTATGLILSNPWGSNKNVAMLEIKGAFSTAQGGAATLGLAASPSPSSTAVTHTTPGVVQRGMLFGNSANSVAFVDTAATTVGTPVFVRMLASINATSSVVFTDIDDKVNGAIVLPPGSSIQLAFITTAIVGNFSFTWLEYKV